MRINKSVASTFEILYTLVEKGYLEVADKKLKSFKLGIKLYQACCNQYSKLGFEDSK